MADIVSARIDSEPVNRALRQLARSRYPKATAEALNKTAFEILNAVKRHVADIFRFAGTSTVGANGLCEMVLADGPCCDQAPPALAEIAKRNSEPASQAAIAPRFTRVIAVRRARRPARVADLELRVSPLRLSVVLRT